MGSGLTVVEQSTLQVPSHRLKLRGGTQKYVETGNVGSVINYHINYSAYLH